VYNDYLFFVAESSIPFTEAPISEILAQIPDVIGTQVFVLDDPVLSSFIISQPL
jgi:hypothetical protein